MKNDAPPKATRILLIEDNAADLYLLTRRSRNQTGLVMMPEWALSY